MSGLDNKIGNRMKIKQKNHGVLKFINFNMSGKDIKELPSLNSFINTNKDNPDDDYINDYYNQSPYLSIANPQIRTLIS